MITFRRELLDGALERNVSRIRGRVLDVGGRKVGKRGRFQPPLGQVTSWEYLNPDSVAEPDYLGTAENIPLPDGSVDTVIMTEVLEYVADPGRAFAEMRRVLRPGGFCLVTIPFLMAMHGDSAWDRQRFTRVRLRELAVDSGFEVEAISEMGSLGAVVHDLLHAHLGYASGNCRKISYRLGRRLLALAAPVFRCLDGLSERQKPFINTGYLMALSKPGLNP